jgi:hypothetical protein
VTEVETRLLPHAATWAGLREPTNIHLALTGTGGAGHFEKFFADPDLQALIAASGAAPGPPEITIAEAITSPDQY